MTTTLREAFDHLMMVRDALLAVPESQGDLASAEAFGATTTLLSAVLQEKEETMHTCLHCRTLYVLACTAAFCMQQQSAQPEYSADMHNLYVASADLILHQLADDFDYKEGPDALDSTDH